MLCICFYYMYCMSVCLNHEYRVQKWTSDPLDPEVQIVVSYCVSTGIKTQVFWENILC